MSLRGAAIAAAIGLVALVGEELPAFQGSASAACNFYSSGLDFVRKGSLAAALADFQKVDACPDVNIRAQALLQKGRVFLRVWPRQYAEARDIANRLTTGQYLDTPSAPAGFILLGMIELAENRNFKLAQEQFSRVNRNNFASSDAFAEAQYRAAEAYRLARDTDAALRGFRDVTLRYPATVWAARSLIGAANCFVEQGDTLSAMEALQRVRRDFRDSAEAGIALKRNTILHRLTMRGSTQTAQVIGAVGRGKYRDGTGLAVDAEGRIILGYRDGLAVFSGETLEQVKNPLLGAADSEASAVGLAPGSVPALARRHLLLLDTEPVSQFLAEVPRAGKTEAADIQAFVTNWKNEWLVADGRTEAIHRFTNDWKHAGVFAPNVQASRIVQNDIDDVAVLNARTKGIQFYARDGSPRDGIARRDPKAGYDFDTPVDLAFDVLGNLYVLDGPKFVIYVFDPARRLRTAIQLPAKSATPLRRPVALAIDGIGRLFVLDRDGQQVVAYQ